MMLITYRITEEAVWIITEIGDGTSSILEIPKGEPEYEEALKLAQEAN